jgi:hypothetical protein
MSTAITGLTAIAITMLRGYFELMRMAGRTPEEIERFYATESTAFYGVNSPGNLPRLVDDQ